MRQPLFIKNKPINEERINFIETVVSRLCRRTRKQTCAMITPFPISNAVFGTDVKGAILRYMFPCEGIITKGLVDIGVKLKSGAMLTLDVVNSVHSVAKSYVMNRDTFLISPNIEVDSGDKITISIFPNDPEEFISEVWSSFLWVPSVKKVDIKRFLYDEIEDDLFKE